MTITHPRHSLTHPPTRLLAVALLFLAACSVSPYASSAEAEAEAARLRARERQSTAQAIAEAQAKRQATAEAQAAIANAANAQALEATAASNRATAAAINDQATIDAGRAQITKAWQDAEQTAIPARAAATEARRIDQAQRAAAVVDIAGLLLVALASAALLGVLGLVAGLILEGMEGSIDTLTIWLDMQRMRRRMPAEKFDASKQTGGTNGHDGSNDGSAPADGRAVPGVQPGHESAGSAGGVRP